MGKKHFSEEQIAFALRQAESGTAVAEIIRELVISDANLNAGAVRDAQPAQPEAASDRDR